MEQTTAGELIRKLTEEKGITLYSLSVKTGRFGPSAYETLKRDNLRMDIFIDLLNGLDVNPIIEIEGRKFELIKKQSKN